MLAPTPMDAIPLYARAGAVVPMWTEAPPSTSGYFPAAVELHLFVPLRDGTYHSVLQEDDGLTFAAQDGGCVKTSFVVQRQGGQLAVRASVTGDGYPEHAREGFVLVLHGADPAGVLVDGQPVEVVDRRASFANAGSGFDVDVVLSDLG